jgi:methionine-gamma-lyase
MISFKIEGGESDAFKFLNNLKLVKLAVSLGSTESLAQHPASMTHIGLLPELKSDLGITDGLIRLSVGIEHFEDLITDISDSLDLI